MVFSLSTMITSQSTSTKPHNLTEEPSIGDMQKPSENQRRSPTLSCSDTTDTVSDPDSSQHGDELSRREQCHSLCATLGEKIGKRNPEEQSTADDTEQPLNKTCDSSSNSFQCSCKMWTCGQCNKAFNSARALKIHEVKQHENVPKRYLKCSHCDEVFEHGNLLQIHMKVHHDIKVRCPQCKNMFDHPRVLSMHFKAQHSEPVCLVCGVKFDHDKILKLHMEHYHKVNKKEDKDTESNTELDRQEEKSGEREILTSLPNPDDQCAESASGDLLSPENVEKSTDNVGGATRSSPNPAEEPVGMNVSNRTSSPEVRSYQSSLSDSENNVKLPRMEGGFHLDRRPHGFPPDHLPGRWETFAPNTNIKEAYHEQLLSPHGLPSTEERAMTQVRADVRHHDHRPLGRSRSFPTNQGVLRHSLVPVFPWSLANNGMPLRGEFPRERRPDRAMLEAVRNSLRAKLRSVEATLLEDDGSRHRAFKSSVEPGRSSDPREYYYASVDILGRPYRPSVITSRGAFDDESPSLKRKSEDKDDYSLEPPAKASATLVNHGKEECFVNTSMDVDTKKEKSRATETSTAKLNRDMDSQEEWPRMMPRIPARTSTRTIETLDSREAIPTRKVPSEFEFGDHAKIFIKRGAPRCNRCQQTFSSKMEYLHHLISHREKDGYGSGDREELEFLESMSEEVESSKTREMIQRKPKTYLQKDDVLDQSLVQKEEVQVMGKDENTEERFQTPRRTGSPPAPVVQMPALSPQTPSNSFSNVLSLGTATCSQCNDVFADTLSCRMHIEKRHMKPRCRECGLEFDHKNLLKIHMDCYHSTMEVLQCYYCGISFKHRSEFLDHVTSHEIQSKGGDGKDKSSELGSEPVEPSRRRRWSRLVASAQLPSDKVGQRKEDLGNPKKSDAPTANCVAFRSGEKRKLTKTLSLPCRETPKETEMSTGDSLWKRRAKDDSSTREMRTRIFMPSLEDKQKAKLPKYSKNGKSYLPASDFDNVPLQREIKREIGQHVQMRTKFDDLSSSSREEGNLFIKAKNGIAKNEMSPAEASFRNAFTIRETGRRLPSFSHHRERHEKQENETRFQGVRHKKIFVRQEKMEAETVFQNDEHRNALVKIERVERDPAYEQVKPSVEQEQDTTSKAAYDSEWIRHAWDNSPGMVPRPISNQRDTFLGNPLVGAIQNSLLKRFVQDPSSSSAPPPLISVRRILHIPSPLAVSPGTSADSSPTSSRSSSPFLVKGQGTLPRTLTEPPEVSNLRGQSIEKPDLNAKGPRDKRRDSIKKLTKEALLNSLTLKRRSSAPDLSQLHQSPNDVAIKAALFSSKGAPECNSRGFVVSSTSQTTESSRSASLFDSPDDQASSASPRYSPRRKSSRDITCHQCGVSFGHKKLFKIHLDSYHGEKQAHTCLECGGKSFQDKDEFLKHLMAHQESGAKSSSPKGNNQEKNEQSKVTEAQTAKSPPGSLFGDDSEPKVKRPGSEHQEEFDSLPSGNGTGGNSFESAHRSHHNLRARNEGSRSEKTTSVRLQRNQKDRKDKTSTCFICGKTFENGKQLEHHLSSHASINEDGRYCCSLCKKAFDTPRKLEIHSRSHTGFKPHKCEFCGRCFPYYSSYYYHKMTHTKDRPHKCPLCGKGFIQTRYLRSHLRTHKDEQGTSSAEVENIIRTVDLNMKEEEPASPELTENSVSSREEDEQTATAEILCSFRHGKGLTSFREGLYNSSQNSDGDSIVDSPRIAMANSPASEESVFSSEDESIAV